MVLQLMEVSMMGRHLSSRVLAVLVFALTRVAPALPAQRIVDLTAADGTKLKATYFAAAKPGPGVLLLHQCNRQRKVWDGLAQQLAAVGINVLTLDYRGSKWRRFKLKSGPVTSTPPLGIWCPSRALRVTRSAWVARVAGSIIPF